MNIFQGDSDTISLTIKDADGVLVDSDTVNDMVAVLYLEHNKKPYVYWALTGGTVYDRSKYPTLTTRTITQYVDGITFTFNLESSDTTEMMPGRYIIQVSCHLLSEELSEGKYITKYGALTSVKQLN